MFQYLLPARESRALVRGDIEAFDETLAHITEVRGPTLDGAQAECGVPSQLQGSPRPI